MKNQYAGDIGDYTKLGLLRMLEKAGFSIGINWYLTPDEHDNSPTKTDGKHTDFLNKPCDTYDKFLFEKLKEIIDSDSRSVQKLEDSRLLDNTLFFSELLNPKQRKGWHQKALNVLSGQDIVFLDPDNGLEVKSCKPHCKNGNKYTTYQEAADYYKNGSTVIIYNHRDRKPEEEYLKRFTKFLDENIVPEAVLFYVRAPKYTVRDYLFLAQLKHASELRKAIGEAVEKGWSRYMKLKNQFA